MKYTASPRRSLRRVLLVVASVGALTLAGCASTPGTAPTTTPGGGGDSSAVEKAKENMAKWSSGPETIVTDVPLDEAPSPDELVVYAQCTDVPLCTNYGDGLQIALDELSWDLERVNWTAAQPASFPTALLNALQFDPIAVASGSEDYNFWRQVVPDFEAAGVPLLPFGADKSVPVNETLLPTATGDIFYETLANLMADYVIADSDGAANVLFVNHTDFSGPRLTGEALEKRMAECEGCVLNTLPISATQFQNLPNLVAAEVQKYPDLDYVLINPPGFSTQIVGALEAAGLLDGLKVVNTDMNSGDIEQIKGGQLVAVGRAYGMVTYQATDTILRAMQGLEIPQANSDVPLVLVTADNIDDFEFTGKWLEPNFDYAAEYRKLWNLDG